MDEKIKKAKEHFENHHYRKDVERSIVSKVNHQINVKKRPNSFTKKIVLTCSIVIFCIAALLGSTFVSPTMAEVFAKVPFISEFMKTKEKQMEHREEINQNLRNQFEHFLFIDPNFDEKKATITLDAPKKYINENKDMITNLAKEELKAYGYDGFSISIEKFEPMDDPDLSPEDQQLVGEIQKAMESINNKLLDSEFNSLSFGINSNKEITMDLPYHHDKEDLINLIEEALREGNHKGFSIEINTLEQEDLDKREQQRRWGNVHRYIMEGLQQKEHLLVTGYAYDNNPQPMKVIIKTSIDSSTNNRDEILSEIKQHVVEYLSSTETEKYVKDDRYILIIRDKHHEDIFEEEFIAK